MWLYDEEEEKKISYYRLRELFNDEGADDNVRNRIKEIVANRKPQDADDSVETLLKKVAYQTHAREFGDTTTPEADALSQRIKSLVTTALGNDYDKLDEFLEKSSFEDLVAIVAVYEGIVAIDESHKEIASHINDFVKEKILEEVKEGLDVKEDISLRELDAIKEIASNMGEEELGNDYTKLIRQYNHAILINKSSQLETITQEMREKINSDENDDFKDIKDIWNNLDIAAIGENNLPVDDVVSEESKQDHWNIMLESAIAKVMHDNLRTLELEQEARVVDENTEDDNQVDNDDTRDEINPNVKFNLSLVANEALREQVKEQLREDVIALYIANAIDRVAKTPDVLSELGLTNLTNPGEEPVKPTDEELAALSDEDKKTKLEEYDTAKKEYDEKYSQLQGEIKEALGNIDDKDKINSIVLKLQDELSKEPEDQRNKIVVNPYLIMDTASERETALSLLRKDIFKDYRRKDSKAGEVVKEQENKLAESSRKIFGKLHDFAVGIRQLAKNDSAKAIEIASQLGVAGGNMVFAGISLFGGKEALASIGGQAFATVLAGAMVANQVAKGTVFPLARAYKNLKGSNLSGWAKFKAAWSEVNRKEPEWWINAATGVVAGAAWLGVSAVASPLAGKIVASGVVAIGNYVAKQTEFNRRKKLLKLLESSKPQSAKDIKLIGELRTELYGDKEQEKPKGIFGKIKAWLQPKKNQTILAGVGAGFGALGIVGQASNIMSSATDVVNPTDSLRTGGVNPTDVVDQTDPNTFTPTVDEKTGMTIWKEPVTKNGVTETYMQDAKGRTFIRYEGLSTSHKVSEASYANLIDKINSKGNLNFKMEDGSTYTFEETVQIMREKLQANPGRLPEGMGENQAIYLAMMRARYTGNNDIINSIKCGNNDLSDLLTHEATKYATNPGHIGRLITEKPLPTKVGPASIIGDPCVPSARTVSEVMLGEQTGEDITLNATDKVQNVDWNDGSVVAAYTHSGNGSNHQFSTDSLNGKVKSFSSNDLTFKVWDSDGVKVGDVTSGKDGVEVIAPVIASKANVEALVSKLGEQPTNITRDDKTGAISYIYEMGKGKSMTFVMDAPNENGTSTGHIFLGKKEIIISEEAQSVVANHLSKTTKGPEIVSVGDQPKADAVTVEDKIRAKKDAWFTDRANDMKNPAEPQENYDTYFCGHTDKNVELTTEHREAIISGKGSLFCTGEQDGIVTFNVVGIDGVDKISIQSPLHLEMASSEASPTVTLDDTSGVYKVGMQTADKKPLTVVIDPTNSNGTQVLFEGKKVILDTYTAEKVETMTETALKDSNVNADIKLHTPLTQKFVHQVENFRVKQALQRTVSHSK